LDWLACLRRYLEDHHADGDPVCMVVDFNIALDDRDIHDPQRLSGGIMASEAECLALRQVLEGRLEDVFRLFEPDRGHWSWWDYRSGAWDRDSGWRIDHIYLSEELQERASGCLIHKAVRGNDKPSDHAPVLLQLQWPPDDENEELEADAWAA
jgi:exodeoxyribonuclease III